MKIELENVDTDLLGVSEKAWIPIRNETDYQGVTENVDIEIY